MENKLLDEDAILFLEDYKAALNDLKDIARSKIDCLTMIAEDNKQYATIISKEIYSEIFSATPDRILPLVYVMDSIVKKMLGEFLLFFEPKLMQIFQFAWSKGDAKTQQRLKKLALTWPGVFKAQTLAQIEKIYQPSPAQTQKKPHSVQHNGSSFSPIRNPIPLQQPNHFQYAVHMPVVMAPPMPQIIYAQQSSVNLLATNINSAILQLQKHIFKYQNDSAAQAQLAGLKQILMFISSTTLTQLQFEQISSQTTSLLAELSSVLSRPSPPPPPTPQSSTYHSSVSQSAPISTALIHEIPFTQVAIGRQYPRACEKLYDEIGLQCKQCGFRFHSNEEGRKKMQAHMDSHFRTNRRMKDKGSKAFSRDWFLSEDDWVCLRDVDTMRGQVPSFFEVAENSAEDLRLQKPTRDKIMRDENGDDLDEEEGVPMSEDNRICAICHEKFETYWDEEEEEWMLKDAIKYGDLVVHKTCHIDAIASRQVLGKRKTQDE